MPEVWGGGASSTEFHFQGKAALRPRKQTSPAFPPLGPPPTLRPSLDGSTWLHVAGCKPPSPVGVQPTEENRKNVLNFFSCRPHHKARPGQGEGPLPRPSVPGLAGHGPLPPGHPQSALKRKLDPPLQAQNHWAPCPELLHSEAQGHSAIFPLS